MRLLTGLFIATVAVAAVSSCGRMDYKKSPGGLVYKIYSDGKGDSVKEGYFIKYYFEQKVNDSIYRSTFGGEPGFVQAVTTGERYDISELWTRLRKGDSIIVIQSLDTLLKKGRQLPPEIKKGDLLRITLKVLDVFKTDSAMLAYQKADAEKRIATEKEEIKKYLADKKIEDVKETPSGAFIKITEPGSDMMADSGKLVSVMYHGTSWSGVVFDSSIDTSFGHAGPMQFTVDVTPMIKGFSEGIKLLRKGGKAIFYIPSVLGYGANGRPPHIKPNEHLIFDIELVDVKDAPATPQPPLPQPRAGNRNH